MHCLHVLVFEPCTTGAGSNVQVLSNDIDTTSKELTPGYPSMYCTESQSLSDGSLHPITCFILQSSCHVSLHRLFAVVCFTASYRSVSPVSPSSTALHMNLSQLTTSSFNMSVNLFTTHAPGCCLVKILALLHCPFHTDDVRTRHPPAALTDLHLHSPLAAQLHAQTEHGAAHTFAVGEQQDAFELWSSIVKEQVGCT